MSGDPFIFRVFLNEPPGFVEQWRQGSEASEWHRHYLVRPGHSLVLVRGERLDLVRHRTAEGFRVDHTLLSAAFPLDWMALACIGSVLPPALKDLEIDGSSAQAFVDSMAVEGLPQASVLKQVSTAFHGTIVARTTWLSVPEWEATALSFSLSGMQPHALRALISAAGWAGVQHRDLDDWLRQARREWRLREAPEGAAGRTRAA